MFALRVTSGPFADALVEEWVLGWKRDPIKWPLSRVNRVKTLTTLPVESLPHRQRLRSQRNRRLLIRGGRRTHSPC